MIDLHTHLLPGVDDGAQTIEVSLRVLRRFAAEGVTTVVCTPHLRASTAGDVATDARNVLLDELRRQLAADTSLELRVGWEIMLDRFGVDFTAPALRLGGAAAVLVELPRTGIPLRTVHELARIRECGVVPVLAHPERYWGCAVAHVREWRAAGAVMQGEAATLVGSGARGELARALLAEGLLDLLASDNHGDDRSLSAVAQWLREQEAELAATQLLRTNPARVLAGEPMEPVVPVVVRPGVLGRLRSLLLGGR